MPQILRGTFSALRKSLMYFCVFVNLGFLALGSSAWSRTSAATILQFLHSLATVLVNFAADAGLRHVGCVKWLTSFHGEMTFAVGNVAKNAFIAFSYAFWLGSLQIPLPMYLFWLHFDESPRVCWKDTRTSTPCDCAAARYARSRAASRLLRSSATS